MKKSELREIIREEIKNIQKEYSSGDEDDLMNWTQDFFTNDNHGESNWKLLKGYLALNGWKVSDGKAQELFNKMKPSSLNEDVIDYKKKLKNYFEKTNNTKRLEKLKNLPEVEVIKWYNYFKPFIEKSQLNESLAYICGTCGERAEHEEIEDNPNMRCSNCGNVNWE